MCFVGLDNERIEIALASDAGYAAGLMVSAVSIAAFASKSATLSFTFIDGGFSDSFYEELTRRINAVHPLAETRRIRLDAARFASFGEWRGNKVAYARLMLPELLPDASYVVYCDADTLWLADISALWSLRDSAASVLAVRDPKIGDMREREWFESRGFKYDSARYFNSGVMLMNLDLFRKNRLAERACDILSKFPDSLFADQGPLNIVAGDTLKLIDDRWMRFTNAIESKDFSLPLVCHYVNDVPWERVALSQECSDARMAWHFFRARFCGQKVGWRRALLYFVTRNRLLAKALRAVLCLLGRHVAADVLKRTATCAVRRLVVNPSSEQGNPLPLSALASLGLAARGLVAPL